MKKTNFVAGEMIVCPRQKMWLGSHCMERLRWSMIMRSGAHHRGYIEAGWLPPACIKFWNWCMPRWTAI
jgi:hypothetical protein